jgi:hypothetical protein
VKNPNIKLVPFVLVHLGGALLLMTTPACDESFDPRGALDQQLVVFSVLSTDRDMQFVRVQANYMPPSYDPLSQTVDLSVRDASVTLNGPTKSYSFRDTTLARIDPGRYHDPIHLYYFAHFTPQRGKPYQLNIVSPSHGQVSGSITMPDAPKITLAQEVRDILDRPDKYAMGTPMIFSIQLSKYTKGFIAHLVLYYDVMKKGDWVEEAVEIPITSHDSSSYSMDIPVYPGMIVSSSTSGASVVYKNGYYKGTLNKKNSQYHDTQIIFKWATLVVLQADHNLYDYYANTHVSQDPFSLRLDEPLVSSVSDGIGLVGAYSLDSTVYLLPYNFWGNR